MPCCSSAAGRSLNLTLLRCATSVSVWFSCSSDTLMPSALGALHLDFLQRPVARAPAGAGCPAAASAGRPAAGVSMTTWTCWSSELCSTMPSLTTATTRSSETPRGRPATRGAAGDSGRSAPARAGRRRGVGRSCPGRRRALRHARRQPASIRRGRQENSCKSMASHGLGLGRERGVSTNRVAQESFVVHSDTRQALEFKLEADRRVGAAGAAADESARDRRGPPSSTTSTRSPRTGPASCSRQRVDPAREGVPVRADRPGRRHVELLEQVALVAVGAVHDAVARRPVLQRRPRRARSGWRPGPTA